MEHADPPIGHVGNVVDELVPEPLPPEDDERPDWLPEKFKSPEALARSYAEAEKKIREQGEVNSLRDQLAAYEEELTLQIESCGSSRRPRTLRGFRSP